MKESTRRGLASVLALFLASPCAAAPTLMADVSVSSPSARAGQEPIIFKFSFEKGTGAQGRSSIGAGGGISDGKPLEMMVWGSGGAVAGSLTGPAGAIIGAAAGAFVGLIIRLKLQENGRSNMPPDLMATYTGNSFKFEKQIRNMEIYRP